MPDKQLDEIESAIESGSQQQSEENQALFNTIETLIDSIDSLNDEVEKLQEQLENIDDVENCESELDNPQLQKTMKTI